jgi:ABC-2 type transport system ATP-binding protein
MRIILGLDAPDAGTTKIDGQAYADLTAPVRKVGSLLEATAIQGGRSAYNHLRWIAQAAGIGKRRVDEVIDVVGLRDVAGRRVETFSMGMSQRLGIATALLGDPEILLFDEPVNGLDPEGIVWVRTLMKRLAAEGRTVFVSSHLMSEMQDTAEHVIVIGRGKLIADMSMREFIQHSSGNHVRVVSPRAAELAALLGQRGAVVSDGAGGGLVVREMEAPEIGELAAEHSIPLHELSNQSASLEAAFIELTRDAVEYHAGGEEAAPSPAAVASGDDGRAN